MLRYRGMGNPGMTRIEAKDGRVFELTYNDLWEDESKWMLQFRCKICPDAIGELADIAVSDVGPAADRRARMPGTTVSSRGRREGLLSSRQRNGTAHWFCSTNGGSATSTSFSRIRSPRNRRLRRA